MNDFEGCLRVAAPILFMLGVTAGLVPEPMMAISGWGFMSPATVTLARRIGAGVCAASASAAMGIFSMLDIRRNLAGSHSGYELLRPSAV